MLLSRLVVDVENDACLGGGYADLLYGGTVGGEVKLVEDSVLPRYARGRR